MHSPYEQIKRDLKSSGSSLRALARELGVSHTAVVDVAKQERRSARISQALANKLQVPVENLWKPQTKKDNE